MGVVVVVGATATHPSPCRQPQGAGDMPHPPPAAPMGRGVAPAPRGAGPRLADAGGLVPLGLESDAIEPTSHVRHVCYRAGGIRVVDTQS